MNPRLRLPLAAATAAIALAVGAPTAPAALTSETLKLDTREAPAPGVAGDATTSDALQAGALYLATASGRFSFYPQSIWTNPAFPIVLCGTPQPISEPSPGRPAGLGGNDVETIFAAPASFGCGNFKPPIHWTNFRISTGGAAAHVEPLGGPYSAPTSDGAYEYVLTGEGAPATFSLADSNAADNNGVVTIAVRRAGAADCKKGGFLLLGGFKNQGACVSSFMPDPQGPPSA